MARPTRKPVNDPGPMPTAISSIADTAELRARERGLDPRQEHLGVPLLAGAVVMREHAIAVGHGYRGHERRGVERQDTHRGAL